MISWQCQNSGTTDTLKAFWKWLSPASWQNWNKTVKNRASRKESPKYKPRMVKLKSSLTLRIAPISKKWRHSYRKYNVFTKAWPDRARNFKTCSSNKLTLCTRWEISVLSYTKNQERYSTASPKRMACENSTTLLLPSTTCSSSGVTSSGDSLESSKKISTLSSNMFAMISMDTCKFSHSRTS